MKKIRNFSLILIAFLSFQGIEKGSLKADKKRKLQIPEPSDICLKTDRSGYFVVSDDGFLFETDSVGKVLRKSSFLGFDFEGVFQDTSGLWVMDERTRFLYRFNTETLLPISTVEIPYSGGRNKGFEAICRNPKNGRMIVITEKDPIWIMELDAQQRIVYRIRFNGLSDVSAATVWNGNLYFLSDEDHCIARISPIDYSIEKKVSIKVLNPEGLSPACNKGLVVSSDDQSKLYFFENELTLP